MSHEDVRCPRKCFWKHHLRSHDPKAPRFGPVRRISMFRATKTSRGKARDSGKLAEWGDDRLSLLSLEDTIVVPAEGVLDEAGRGPGDFYATH